MSNVIYETKISKSLIDKLVELDNDIITRQSVVSAYLVANNDITLDAFKDYHAQLVSTRKSYESLHNSIYSNVPEEYKLNPNALWYIDYDACLLRVIEVSEVE